MFDKYRHLKMFGLLVVLIAIIALVATNVRIKTVKQYKAEQESNVAEQESLGNIVAQEVMSEKQKETTGVATVDKQETEETNKSTTAETAAEIETESQTERQTEPQAQSQTERQTQAKTQATKKVVTCTIEIRCDAAVERKDSISNPGLKNSIPNDGVIIEKTTFAGYEGYTVFDVLEKVTQMKNVNMVCNSTKTYVSSIGGLSEKDIGRYSGWTYVVNGEMVMRSANTCKINDGDTIVWNYVVSD